MKILIVRTFPNIIDPNQYNMQEIGLAKALVRAGHTCGIVLYYGKNKDLIETIPVLCGDEQREITVYRLHGFGILKNGFFPSLHKITKEYDVIQVHEYDQITSWFYYAWSKKPVVIYHGPYYDEFNRGYNLKCKIFDNVFLRLKHNRNVICMTKSELAAEFLRKKGFKNVHAVGVGLDIENLTNKKSDNEKEIPLRDNKRNLIYVGKIEPRRNPEFLLNVMQKICEKREDVDCIVIGNGNKEDVNRFLDIAKKKINPDRFFYYEEASQNQLSSLYRRVQLMLFPSRYEIFGMVLIEALYFGLPVITSKNGGAEQIAGYSSRGRIVETFDIDDWVMAIEDVFEMQNGEFDGTNLPDKTVSWDFIVDKFINCYNKVCN